MIIIGYQGIGKSTLAEKYENIIDLESSDYFNNGVRPHDWYKHYVTEAMRLSEQGHIVFVSSHQVVRFELANRGYKDVGICYPSDRLEFKWIDKLEKRYTENTNNKNYRAYTNAKMNYRSSIKDMEKDADKYGFTKFVIRSMDYNLEELIGIKED